MLTAQEANNLFARQNDRVQNTLADIDRQVRQACEDGEKQVNAVFSDDLRDSEIDTVVDSLEVLGYTVSYNGACLWYEITW